MISLMIDRLEADFIFTRLTFQMSSFNRLLGIDRNSLESFTVSYKVYYRLFSVNKSQILFILIELNWFIFLSEFLKTPDSLITDWNGVLTFSCRINYTKTRFLWGSCVMNDDIWLVNLLMKQSDTSLFSLNQLSWLPVTADPQLSVISEVATWPLCHFQQLCVFCLVAVSSKMAASIPANRPFALHI